MRDPQSPCKGCTFETGRSIEPNCHTTCGKYLNYKRELKKWKEPVKEGQDIETAMSELYSSRRARFAKRRRR